MTFIIGVCVCLYYFYLFLNRNNGESQNEKWIEESIQIQRIWQENLVMFTLIMLVWLLGKGIFGINIHKMDFFERYGKLIIGVYLIYVFCQMKKRHQNLDFSKFLDNVLEHKYSYLSSENILQLQMERLEDFAEVQKTKIDILKTLFPSTLIPLIVGYVLENKKVTVDWNMFTINFGFLVIFYFFQLWKSYKNLKTIKYRIYRIKENKMMLQELKKNTEKQILK